jgi:hypothetical protein
MCVLIFSTNFLWNISHSEKNASNYYYKRPQVFMSSTRYCGQILVKTDFSAQIFEKFSNIKFYKNTYIWNRVVPY